MSDPASTPPQVPPAPSSEPAEHPLSLLLFSWTRAPMIGQTLLAMLGIVCAVFVALDFVFHRPAKNPVEGFPGFFGVYGFLAFGLAALGAWAVARLLRRPGDFYTRNEKEPGDDR